MSVIVLDMVFKEFIGRNNGSLLKIYYYFIVVMDVICVNNLIDISEYRR